MSRLMSKELLFFPLSNGQVIIIRTTTYLISASLPLESVQDRTVLETLNGLDFFAQKPISTFSSIRILRIIYLILLRA